MTKAEIKAFHSDIDTTLKEVAERNGYIYRPGGVRYSDIEVSGRMVFVKKGSGDNPSENLINVKGLMRNRLPATLKHGQILKICGCDKTFTLYEVTQRGGITVKNDRGTLYRVKAEQLLDETGEKLFQGYELPPRPPRGHDLL